MSELFVSQEIVTRIDRGLKRLARPESFGHPINGLATGNLAFFNSCRPFATRRFSVYDNHVIKIVDQHLRDVGCSPGSLRQRQALVPCLRMRKLTFDHRVKCHQQSVQADRFRLKDFQGCDCGLDGGQRPVSRFEANAVLARLAGRQSVSGQISKRRHVA